MSNSSELLLLIFFCSGSGFLCGIGVMLPSPSLPRCPKIPKPPKLKVRVRVLHKKKSKNRGLL